MFTGNQVLGLEDLFNVNKIRYSHFPYGAHSQKREITHLLNTICFPAHKARFIFTKIIWPLSKPILATIAIFGAVGHWNSFTDSLILMQDNAKLFTLQHLLYNYLNASANMGGQITPGTDVGAFLDNMKNSKVMKYTVSMVSIIPILLVYPYMQRYFEKGIMLGAVKG